MFIFINLGNRGGHWYAAPGAFALMLLLNSGLLNDLLTSASQLFLRMNERHEGSSEHPTWWSPWAQMLVSAILVFLLCKFVSMARRVGFWQALYRFFITGVHGQFGQGFNWPSQRPNFDAVSKIIQKLPADVFTPEEDLGKLPIHELKVKLERCKVNTSGFSEKQDLVDALKKTTFVSNTTCSICCEDYAAKDTLRILPCNHTFHLECIDRWFLASTEYSRPTACPYCNFDLSNVS